MTLKYKIGDEVVLGENVECDHRGYFTPGAIVRITKLCDEGSVDEHYTIHRHRVYGKGSAWWVKDSEINHKATEELQESIEIGDIAGKTEAVSDDNDKEVRTPTLKGSDENGWFKRGELPPVGIKVIFYSDDFDNEGYWHNKLTNNSEVEIIAHFATDGSETLNIAAFTFRYENYWIQVEQAMTCCFRPIKTAEEIAEAEMRATYCDQIYAILCKAERKNNRSDMAESLYDAGLRFVGGMK